MQTQELIGNSIYELCAKLFPICRSITGNGVRKTIEIINDYIKDTGLIFNSTEVPSGTDVYDWTVPEEWVIRNAYIEDADGNHIVDFKENNLHIMGYSAPIDEWVELERIDEYIFVLEDNPDWIPYITSYYKKRVGFCMSKKCRDSMKRNKYHLVVDSEFVQGSLTYADLIIKGSTDDEILITSYICHPSMANNECSGPSLLSEIVKYVCSLKDRKYTYRFVLEPETIGAICYIHDHYEELGKVKAAFNLSCVGDDRGYYLVETATGTSLSDRVAKNVMKDLDGFKIYPFFERGSDERQYNSVGVDVPMICVGRSKYSEYPEYHTSADDLRLVSSRGFEGSYKVMTDIIYVLENNNRYFCTVKCEPQLGKRGLYPTVSTKDSFDKVYAIINVIAYSNGKKDVIELSDLLGVKARELIGIIGRLVENGLLRLV